MRLSLQSDSDMFDRAGENGVRDTSKRASGIVLAVRQCCGTLGVSMEVPLLELAASIVEGAELNRNTGTNADQRSECAFVEGQGPFARENLAATVQSR